MEDSLELPEQVQELQLNTLLSPAPGAIDSRQTTPPHSLAYSNSTGVKDRRDVQMRSPLAFEESPHKMGLIKTNNENYRLNHQFVSPGKQQAGRTGPHQANEKVANKAQYKKLQPKPKKISRSPVQTTNTRVSPHPQLRQSKRKSQLNNAHEQRKTVDKNNSLPLQRRVRQLEQALHMQTVLSEQLRTKLAVTNNFLESKLQQNSLGYLLNMKNSSRDMKNVDIFVELTNLQKILLEKNIVIDRLKSQLKEQQLEHEKTKLKNSPSPPRNNYARSPNRTLNDQLQKLIEQKQSLMSYIDEQKMKLKSKIEYIVELEEEVNRLADKETHYRQVERPKLVQELGELKRQQKKQKEEMERERMEMNLEGMRYQDEIKSLKENIQALEDHNEKKKKAHSQIEERGVQKQDLEKQLLLKELTLLKNQRDYYLTQYRKRTDESAQLYSLQLKVALLQQ